MRLISYRAEGGWRAGIAIGDVAVDAERAAAAAGLDGATDWASTRAILATDAPARDALAERAAELAGGAHALRLDELRLGPPVPDPQKIICLGLNYRDHADESEMKLPAAPMLFAKFASSLAGPDDPVELPPASRKVDYEAELAVVIGRRAKHATPADALDVIGGVMAFNDLTARDIQHETSQWTAGKAIDGFAPCGPALVTPDELGDLQRLRLSARVNGETVQDATTADMIFPIADTIAFITRTLTLEPGDVIATGTPSGVGVSRDPQLLLHDGDVVEVELEGVGVLRNRMVAPSSLPAGA